MEGEDLRYLGNTKLCNEIWSPGLLSELRMKMVSDVRLGFVVGSVGYELHLLGGYCNMPPRCYLALVLPHSVFSYQFDIGLPWPKSRYTYSSVC